MLQGRRLGAAQVGSIGFGARSLSVEGRPDEARAVATIHAALDGGITLIDTSSSYHSAGAPVGDNERLVGRALSTYSGDRTQVVVATKGGVVRDEDGVWRTDGRPGALRRSIEGSLERLGVDSINLYQFHKPDPAVPYVESIGFLRVLIDEGLIRTAGVSNVDESQVLIAREALGDRLVSVQNQFSLAHRDAESMIALCEQLAIAFLAWGPLGGAEGARGLLGDPRVVAIADERRVSAAVVCIAWVLAASPAVVPLVGATRPSTILDSITAATVTLTESELAVLNSIA